MKKLIAICISFAIPLLSISQFDYIQLKKLNCDKVFILRTIKVNPFKNLGNGYYFADGRVWGRPDLTLIKTDGKDSSHFKNIVRYWCKRKKITDKDDYMLYFYSQKVRLPEEYKEAILVHKSSITKAEGYSQTKQYYYVKSTGDTIKIVQYTYAQFNSNFGNEQILFDMINIDTTANIKSTIESSNKFIALISENTHFYQKKMGCSV